MLLVHSSVMSAFLHMVLEFTYTVCEIWGYAQACEVRSSCKNNLLVPFTNSYEILLSIALPRFLSKCMLWQHFVGQGKAHLTYIPSCCKEFM